MDDFESQGYLLVENLIPDACIDSITAKLDTLYPVRAVSSNEKYAEREKLASLPDKVVWWSQLVMDWDEVMTIATLLDPLVQQYLPDAVWYTSDIVTIEPNSKWINPHVDTPYRFAKWNEDDRLLGIQIIIPLQDTEPDAGATGIVPGSHVRDWDIKECYSGAYNKYFWDNFEQQFMPKGSMLMYNCRLLHSSMPNSLDKPRPVLLFNYLSGAILEEVKAIDNIWSSNETAQHKIEVDYADFPLPSNQNKFEIEYVDPPSKNPKDAITQTFRVRANDSTDSIEIIKWCRRNFGTRGDGWDFSGNMRNVEIAIWSSRLITMYRMWKE
jgi:ectoine hydroxylase-related dioxygenase (phytanoyl-CoA dioxygenase family)